MTNFSRLRLILDRHCRLVWPGLLLALAVFCAGLNQALAQIPSANPPRGIIPGYPTVFDNAIEYSRQGNSMMRLERYIEAAEMFRAGIKLNPYAAMAASLYNNLGMAYQRLGQYDYAIASYQHALRIQPDYALYYKNLVQIYAISGALSQAQEELQSILLNNPDNAEGYYLLGLTYREGSQPELARRCFENFRRIKPYSPLSQLTKTAPAIQPERL